MRPYNMCQHVPPVITVLNVVPGPKSPGGRVRLVHRHIGNGFKPGCTYDAFNPVVTEDRLVQCRRREGVSLVSLQREGPEAIGLRKRRTESRSALGDSVPEELAVGAILLKVLVSPDVVLLGIEVTGRVEVALIENRRGARNGKVVECVDIPDAAFASLLSRKGREGIAIQLSGGRCKMAASHSGDRVLGHELQFGAGR